jgi:hypothetical protein
VNKTPHYRWAWQPTPDDKTKGVTIMQTDAHNMGCEERSALLAQRRPAIASQLRRLAIELTDLDRKLDDIEQSGGRDTGVQRGD